MSWLKRMGVVMACCCSQLAFAGEETVQLAPGPGREQVAARCASCHSLDYILMNSPLLDNAGWERELDKMIKVMGAPVTPTERTEIQQYLHTHYGR